VGWGVADFLARFATRRVGTFRTLLFMQIAGIAALVVWLGARGVGAEGSGFAGFLAFPHREEFWVWVAVSGVLNTLASLAFYRALETGLLTIVSPVCSAYPAVTVLVSVYMGERLSAGHVAGIVCATVGVVLAATSFGAGGASAGEEASVEGGARGAGGELAAGVVGMRGGRGHLTRGVGLAMA
jgi:drug/metabolite transporter (DMT)-like permease